MSKQTFEYWLDKFVSFSVKFTLTWVLIFLWVLLFYFIWSLL